VREEKDIRMAAKVVVSAVGGCHRARAGTRRDGGAM
jgi:hypothetical protein